MPEHADAVRRALQIGPALSARARTIDTTTTSARSGQPRRIEIWSHRVDGRWWLSSLPARRSWYADLLAHPRSTVHLENGVRADLAATAVPVTDEEGRRRVLGQIVDDLDQPHDPGRIGHRTHLEDWMEGSPLVEVRFDEHPPDPAAAER